MVAVRLTFYELVFDVLDSKWRYFFSAPVGTDVAGQRQQQFTELLRRMANALQASDLEVFQANLKHLQRLNDIHKLYQRVR